MSGTQLSISGLGLACRDQALEREGLKITGDLLASRLHTRIPRADVQHHFPQATLRSGFELQAEPLQLLPIFETQALVAWVSGQFDAQPLPLTADINFGALPQVFDAPPSLPGYIDHVLWGENGLVIEGSGLLERDLCFADFEVEVDDDPITILPLERKPHPGAQRINSKALIRIGFRLGCKLTKPPSSRLAIALYGITSRQQRFWLARHSIEQMDDGNY